MEHLAGNEALERRIRAAGDRDTLAHALLFSGPGDRLAAARLTAAVMECTAPRGKPCGVCPACRKALREIHPDVRYVRDAAHKNLAVDVVREIQADAHIRPNEGKRKIYIFEDCALLTEQDQNVLLKVVEEGPEYAAFLFCAENPSAVLATLRSRCVELRLHAAEAAPPQAAGAAEALCRAAALGRRGAVTELAVRLERKKPSREMMEAMLEQGCGVFSQALLALYGQPGEELPALLAKNLTKRQIMHTIETLQKYRRECAYNVGVSHVLGALAVELEDIF